MGSSSLMKGELELNGRRMVVMPSVARSDVDSVIAGNADAKLKASQTDKRNLYLKKDGILNEKNWIH
jgi:hypothetical protein